MTVALTTMSFFVWGILHTVNDLNGPKFMSKIFGIFGIFFGIFGFFSKFWDLFGILGFVFRIWDFSFRIFGFFLGFYLGLFLEVSKMSSPRFGSFLHSNSSVITFICTYMGILQLVDMSKHEIENFVPDLNPGHPDCFSTFRFSSM